MTPPRSTPPSDWRGWADRSAIGLALPSLPPVASDPLRVHPDRSDRVVAPTVERQTRIALVLGRGASDQLAFQLVDRRLRRPLEPGADVVRPRGDAFGAAFEPFGGIVDGTEMRGEQDRRVAVSHP